MTTAETGTATARERAQRRWMAGNPELAAAWREAHAETLMARDGLDPETAGAYARQAIPDAETDDATAAEPEAQAQLPPTPAGILHNGHDVDRLQEECQTLVNQIRARGAAVEMGLLEASSAVQAVLGVAVKKGLVTEEQVGAGGIWALMAWLVNAGVCTEAEMEGERFTAMRAILRSALAEVEAAALGRPRGPRVQAVRGPGLLVAKS